MADTSKINEILNYYGLKTNIEETKKWVKQYVGDALTGITTDLTISGTYDEIKNWRDNGELKPGMLYRMTDYVTKVYSSDDNITSAVHPFDLILFANTTNSLNENAFTILHNGDEYFSNSKLSAWEIKYSIDNDDERFDYGADGNVKQIYTDDNLWFKYVGTRINSEDESQTLYLWYNENFDDSAGIDGYLFTYDRNPELDANAGILSEIDNNTATIDDYSYSVVQQLKLSESGFGIIYYMKDEYNNEAPFDFKNILQNDGEYTFGNNGEDYSLNGYVNGVYNNKILSCVNSETGKQAINKIRVTGEDCNTNIFKPTCVNSYIDFPISECDISMNDDGELVVFKTQDFVSGIENKPIEHNYKNDYLTFEAVNDDTEIIFKTYTDDSQYTKTIEVSKDKVNWESKTSSSEGVILASLNAGEKLYLRGNNSSYAYYYENDGEYLPNFILPLNYCYVYGNVMSLIDGNNFRTLTEITDDYALYSLFYDYWNGNYSSEYLLSHQDKKLELPATTLANWCYGSMFNNCTGLTTAPELPATTLATGCYSAMFRGCSSLTTAPELPATTLADSCYSSMFYGCTSLVTAPTLPATTLAGDCYSAMFRGCSSLTTAPELPATTLADSCYSSMFYGCTSLVTAPELPVTTLASNCYLYMFYRCSSLNYIKCLATDISASNCTTNWVNGVASTGTFVKAANMTGWTTGSDGIPTNWTVEEDYSNGLFD